MSERKTRPADPEQRARELAERLARAHAEVMAEVIPWAWQALARLDAWIRKLDSERETVTRLLREEELPWHPCSEPLGLTERLLNDLGEIARGVARLLEERFTRLKWGR